MARKRNGEIGGYVAWQVRFLETGEVPPDGPDVNGFEATDWQYHGGRSRDPVRQAWAACRAVLLPAWISRHPGSRPYAWWSFDAPGPRLRLGGTGDSAALVPAIRESYRHGLPARWCGKIFSKWYGHTPPDPADPPTFESEAAFLARHNLMTPAERASLSPAAFEPVTHCPTEDETI